MVSNHEHIAFPVYHPAVDSDRIADTLAILRPVGNRSAGKQYRWDGTSWILHSGYDRAKYFRCNLREISDLEAWYALLLRISALNVFLIMGLPTDAANLKRMTRRVKPRTKVDHNGEHISEAPTLADRAGYLLPFDFDSIACVGIDVTQEPDQAIRWLIKTTLPAEFHKAGVVYQFSSSFGLTSDKLKVHLFFWLSTPVTMAEAKEWAKSYNTNQGYVRGNNGTKIVDDTVYQPQQPIYTMNRICYGAVDPVPTMIGILPGTKVDFETVRIQQKQQDKINRAERRKNGQAEYNGRNGSSGQGVAYRLSRIGVDGHHAPIRNAAGAIVATEGRAAVEADLGGFVALLREQVEQADRMGKSEEEFQRTYLTENYLRQQFQSALDAGYGDNGSKSSRAEQQIKVITQFRYSNWLVNSGFPGETVDLAGDL